MGICLCTRAQAQAFARQKINARYRRDELLTTTELAGMISEVSPGYRHKAATYIMKEHQQRLKYRTTDDSLPLPRNRRAIIEWRARHKHRLRPQLLPTGVLMSHDARFKPS